MVTGEKDNIARIQNGDRPKSVPFFFLIEKNTHKGTSKQGTAHPGQKQTYWQERHGGANRVLFRYTNAWKASEGPW